MLLRSLIPLIVVAAALTGCRSKEPDRELLRQILIPPEAACGREGITGETLLDLAYAAPVLDGLPAPEDLPVETLQAMDTPTRASRRFPCAPDAGAAEATLFDLGYTGVRIVRETERVFLLEGVDRAGFEGPFAVFRCEWMGEVTQTLDAISILDLGLRGTFGPGETLDAETLRAFAALTFRTRMTRPAIASRAFAGNDLAFLGLEESLTTEPFPPGTTDTAPGPERTFLRLCATWYEHDVTDGCDRIYLGISHNLLDLSDPSGVHQTVLLRVGVGIELRGYCGSR